MTMAFSGVHVQPNHVGSLGDKLRIIALAAGFAPAEIDLLRAQEAPNLLLVDIAQWRAASRLGPGTVSACARL
jgi:hypothetical protein